MHDLRRVLPQDDELDVVAPPGVALSVATEFAAVVAAANDAPALAPSSKRAAAAADDFSESRAAADDEPRARPTRILGRLERRGENAASIGARADREHIVAVAARYLPAPVWPLFLASIASALLSCARASAVLGACLTRASTPR